MNLPSLQLWTTTSMTEYAIHEEEIPKTKYTFAIDTVHS